MISDSQQVLSLKEALKVDLFNVLCLLRYQNIVNKNSITHVKSIISWLSEVDATLQASALRLLYEVEGERVLKDYGASLPLPSYEELALKNWGFSIARISNLEGVVIIAPFLLDFREAHW